MSSELKAWGRKNATQLKAVFEKHRKKRSKGLEAMRELLPEELAADFDKWKSQIKSTKKYVSCFTKLVGDDEEARATLSETDQCPTRDASESHQDSHIEVSDVATDAKTQVQEESEAPNLDTAVESVKPEARVEPRSSEPQSHEPKARFNEPARIDKPPRKLEFTLEKLLGQYEDDFDVLRRVIKARE